MKTLKLMVLAVAGLILNSQDLIAGGWAQQGINQATQRGTNTFNKYTGGNNANGQQPPRERQDQDSHYKNDGQSDGMRNQDAPQGKEDSGINDAQKWRDRSAIGTNGAPASVITDLK